MLILSGIGNPGAPAFGLNTMQPRVSSVRHQSLFTLNRVGGTEAVIVHAGGAGLELVWSRIHGNAAGAGANSSTHGCDGCGGGGGGGGVSPRRDTACRQIANIWAGLASPGQDNRTYPTCCDGTEDVNQQRLLPVGPHYQHVTVYRPRM